MITEDHQVLIQEAVSTKKKATIDAAFQQVLQEEIEGIKRISNEIQKDFCKLASLLIIPYKQENIIKDDDSNKLFVKKTLKQVGICLFVLVAMTIIGSTFGKLLGILLSIVGAGTLYYYLRLVDNKNISKEKECSLEETIEADVLLDLVDKFISNIKCLSDGLTQNNETTYTNNNLPLHICYPNLVKWLQSLYCDSLNFDEETRIFLIKQITTVADSCGYDIVIFNEGNENMFRINNQTMREQPHMSSPSIVYRKTGKLILPGIVFMSKK